MQDLVLYADTPGWAQHIFVEQLGREARTWGDYGSVEVVTGRSVTPPHGARFYSPCAGAADTIASRDASVNALGGLWSHVSYGGWFSDDPITSRPRSTMHATNLYLCHLTGLPYLAGGVDTDLFSPPPRRARNARRGRLVVGWTGSLQFNAAVKLFADLWLPAVRKSGSDGALRDAKICARPLAVWDCRDARSPAHVAEYLKDIDVYLCTSISEGSSNSLLEAAAAGCAIISTPCGNAPELASRIVGWNIDEIVSEIQRYESDRQLLTEDQELTRERAVNFWSWKSEVKRAAWRAFLAGREVPSWRDQLAYCAATPEDLVNHARRLRERARPALVRGNMMAS